MTYLQVFRYVILMPTLRVVWPPLASQFIATMLGSSVVSQISAEELTYAGMLLESRTFRTFEIFFSSPSSISSWRRPSRSCSP